MRDLSEALYQSALSAWASGDRQAGLEALILATQADTSNPIYLANLAAAFVELGQWTEAEAATRHALELAPQRAESWHGLGNVLTGQQRWAAAAQAYEQAALLNPDLPNCDAVAANAWTRAGNAEQAARRYLRAVSGAQGRDDPELLTAMARTLTQLDQLDKPLELYQRVAQMLPQNAPAQSNLGIIYQARAQYAEAIACYRKAVEIDPGLASCWSNLIVCLNYSPTHAPADVLAAAHAFDLSVAAPLRFSRTWRNSIDPERALRVGYVSPDLHRHAVAYFLLPLLEGHSDQVEVIAYNTSRIADDWTARLRQGNLQWVDCEGWSDEALAERIQEDAIDILVDLAGHTDGNRLLVFARKPAPVQVTWLGYVLTTGMSAIDWRMTYPDTDPQGSDAHYSEKLWRLGGGMWGWRPLPGMPDVAPPPFVRKGHVTFGHLNRFSKISQPALQAWAEILTQLPTARLALGIPPGNMRQEIARFLEARGVAASRIDVYDKMPHERFWAMHGEIDIALDPFPFNGGTTSYETLWMGVPLVSCTGGPGSFAPRFSSRMGHALLKSIGLPELAADCESEYVRIAVALAQDPGRLWRLRNEMRRRMSASPLLDEALHVREIEAAYRGMWRQWCASQQR